MTTPSYSQTPNTGIAFDQSEYLGRIAAALENIAANSASISNTLSTVSTTISAISNHIATVDTNVGIMATNSTKIEGHQSRIKDLANGTDDGIQMVSPWEWISVATVLRVLNEQHADLTALRSDVNSLPKTKS